MGAGQRWPTIAGCGIEWQGNSSSKHTSECWRIVWLCLQRPQLTASILLGVTHGSWSLVVTQLTHSLSITATHSPVHSFIHSFNSFICSHAVCCSFVRAFHSLIMHRPPSCSGCEQFAALGWTVGRPKILLQLCSPPRPIQRS